MVIKAYERCSKWCINLDKDRFKAEEKRQEAYNKWLQDFRNNYKVHRIEVIDDDGNIIIIKGGEDNG